MHPQWRPIGRMGSAAALAIFKKKTFHETSEEPNALRRWKVCPNVFGNLLSRKFFFSPLFFFALWYGCAPWPLESKAGALGLGQLISRARNCLCLGVPSMVAALRCCFKCFGGSNGAALPLQTRSRAEPFFFTYDLVMRNLPLYFMQKASRRGFQKGLTSFISLPQIIIIKKRFQGKL